MLIRLLKLVIVRPVLVIGTNPGYFAVSDFVNTLFPFDSELLNFTPA